MAAKSAVRSPICLKFDLIRAFIIVLITCKNEEDPIKNEGARYQAYLSIFQTFEKSINKLDIWRLHYSAVRRGIPPKLKVIQLLWLSLLPARMKKIQSKMNALEC